MNRLDADEEKLGYPTQKPIGLLLRIIKSSSYKGDTILDPFCGSGAAIAAAQRLGRRWIGIDISHLAITLTKHRLTNSSAAEVIYDVLGEPTPGTEALPEQELCQFQLSALGLLGARPTEDRRPHIKGLTGGSTSTTRQTVERDRLSSPSRLGASKATTYATSTVSSSGRGRK